MEQDESLEIALQKKRTIVPLRAGVDVLTNIDVVASNIAIAENDDGLLGHECAEKEAENTGHASHRTC